MATRFLYEAGLTPPVSPAFDAAWEVTGGAVRRVLSVPGQAERTTLVASSAVTSTSAVVQDVLFAQYVSGPLDAQTISGTVKGQFVPDESNADADMMAQLGIFVCSNDGTSILATLLALHTNALSSEFSTSAHNKKFPLAALSPASLTSYANAAGDRLVVEVGYRRHNTTGASRNAVFYAGTSTDGYDEAADLPESEGDDELHVTRRPWLEFSDDITFVEEATDVGAIWVEVALADAEPEVHVGAIWVEAAVLEFWHGFGTPELGSLDADDYGTSPGEGTGGIVAGSATSRSSGRARATGFAFDPAVRQYDDAAHDYDDAADEYDGG